MPAQRNEEEVQENNSSRHNSVIAVVSNGQTTSQALNKRHFKQGPSSLHHTFLLGRARFTAQPLSALALPFDILILFWGDDLFSPLKLSHGRLPKYLIDGRTFSNQSKRSVRWRTDRLKKAPCPYRRFFTLLLQQSPRGFALSALPRLLPSAPN